jgi:TolB protein
MRYRHFLFVFGLLAFLGGPLVPAAAQDSYQYIDIRNPFLRKIPLALPAFKNLTGAAREADFSSRAVEMMAGSLDFTGFFKIMDRSAFLFDPQKSGVSATEINFQNWTVIGAELLITGLFEQAGDSIQMELRLFDTFKARQVIGKRYSGQAAELRNMVLRFCSEVIYYLTGHKGIFNSRIAFVSTGSGRKEIYTSEFDGYGPTRVTYNDAISLFPSWSSDGEYLAYTSYKGGKPDIYIRSLNTKKESVIALNGINITPSWVPGRFELAATLSYGGSQEIYLLTGAGKVIKKLTNGRGTNVSPSFSPDGSKMAFVSDRAGGPQIYILDLATGGESRLTFEGKYNTQPAWSPRGDKIAYTSQIGGFQQVCVIGADGQNPMQLTRESASSESPSWSPDGTLLVFGTNREGPSRLYVMTAFGTEQRRLLLLNGEQSNPKWSAGVFN